jgi:hypothetical protein
VAQWDVEPPDDAGGIDHHGCRQRDRGFVVCLLGISWRQDAEPPCDRVVLIGQHVEPHLLHGERAVGWLVTDGDEGDTA